VRTSSALITNNPIDDFSGLRLRVAASDPAAQLPFRLGEIDAQQVDLNINGLRQYNRVFGLILL
jgi:hypothetical protein